MDEHIHHALARDRTIDDFPASWEVATPAERSHDSQTYGTRFVLRLDAASETTLQQLITQFGTSKAHIIRQLLTQLNLEDLPTSWHMKVAERGARQALQALMGHDGTPHP